MKQKPENLDLLKKTSLAGLPNDFPSVDEITRIVNTQGKEGVVASLSNKRADFGLNALGRAYRMATKPIFGTGKAENILFFKFRDLEKSRLYSWSHYMMGKILVSDDAETIPENYRGMTWWEVKEVFNVLLWLFYVDGFIPSETSEGSGKYVFPLHIFDLKKVKEEFRLSDREFNSIKKSWGTLDDDQKDLRTELQLRMCEELPLGDFVRKHYKATDSDAGKYQIGLNKRGEGWMRGSITIIPYLTDEESKLITG